MKNIRDALLMLTKGKNLEREMATQTFNSLFQGKLSSAQAGAFLLGLRIKGETPVEVASAVDVAFSHCRQIHLRDSFPKSIDTCGTGGDGKESFNCSTAVSLFLADMGYKVVKHGNKAISGKCGSADVIDALGIPFVKEEKEVLESLASKNFVFLFAPYFHPSFANIAPIRQELGVPTLFNLLGPLVNPARPSHQLIGVGDKRYMETIAEVLKIRGIKRGAVVHGEGFDEVTPTGETHVILVESSGISHLKIVPEDFGIRRCQEEDLRCRDKEEAISLMERVLIGGGPSPIRDMVTLNLGLALFLLEEGLSLKDAMEKARLKISKGIDRGRFYAG